MTNDEFAEKLNEFGVQPSIDEGQVVSLFTWSEEDDEEEQVDLTDEQEKELGIQDGFNGYLVAHPEGSDRGGYVPCISEPNLVYYDENAGRWWAN